MKKHWIILGAAITVLVFVFVMPFVSWQQERSKAKFKAQSEESISTIQQKLETDTTNELPQKDLSKQETISSNQRQIGVNDSSLQDEELKLAIEKAEADRLASQEAMEKLRQEQADTEQLALEEESKLKMEQQTIQKESTKYREYDDEDEHEDEDREYED